MGCAQVNAYGTVIKEFGESKYRLKDENKDFRISIVTEGHGISQEEESRVYDVGGDMKDHCEQVVRVDVGAHKPAPVSSPSPSSSSSPPTLNLSTPKPLSATPTLLPTPPPPPPQPPPLLQKESSPSAVVRWERFLPLRSLKVLLIENDESTRQVVTALLRNCSYEVVTATNGLQAWKILEDLTNHIDLVLTEVVMPYISGIGLLCKIMNHKTCKNIPVIMMSSHDSMGTVFSCLSKGAVDFLVKPIRKNELKNLWQHVWRRCHSSSGSGSGSGSGCGSGGGIQTRKSAKLKSGNESDNNTGSTDEDDDGSTGLNARDGSDNGSGTQSSWTKQVVEVDSPQLMSTSHQFADPHDSTCAQVIHPEPETLCNEWVSMTRREFQEQKEQYHGNVEMGKDLEIGVPGNLDLRFESYPKEVYPTNLTEKQGDLLQEDTQNKQPNDKLLDLDSNNPFSDIRTQKADLVDDVTKVSTNAQTRNEAKEIADHVSKISENKEKAVLDTRELPSLELSLKRLRSAGDNSSPHGDRNVLRHSYMSAFSRYNTATSATQTPNGCTGSNSGPLDNSLGAVKKDSTNNPPSTSNVTPLNHGSNGSSNNNDMGSTTNNAFSKPATFKNTSASTSAPNCVPPTSAYQAMQPHHAGAPMSNLSEKVDASVSAVERAIDSQHQYQVQHHHHHYHHHHHHIHNSQQKQLLEDHDNPSMKIVDDSGPQCGSSNAFGMPMEGNGGNYSMNGSVKGSNHGRNGHNGSCTAVNRGGMNVENDNGVAGIIDASGGSGSGSVSGADQNRVARRVAALTKFRQKRKERCFEKKVRYQSRKRLAEQRPRVRGQFVRQNVCQNTSEKADY